MIRYQFCLDFSCISSSETNITSSCHVASNHDSAVNFYLFQGRKGDTGFRGPPGVKGARVSHNTKKQAILMSNFTQLIVIWCLFHKGEPGSNGRPGNDGPEVRKQFLSNFKVTLF